MHKFFHVNDADLLDGRIIKSKFKSFCPSTGALIKQGEKCLYLPKYSICIHSTSKFYDKYINEKGLSN